MINILIHAVNIAMLIYLCLLIAGMLWKSNHPQSKFEKIITHWGWFIFLVVGFLFDLVCALAQIHIPRCAKIDWMNTSIN